jgi:hypothetical protein
VDHKHRCQRGLHPREAWARDEPCSGRCAGAVHTIFWVHKEIGIAARLFEQHVVSTSSPPADEAKNETGGGQTIVVGTDCHVEEAESERSRGGHPTGPDDRTFRARAMAERAGAPNSGAPNSGRAGGEWRE